MSTKINNGYQVPNMSMSGMRRFLDKVRRKIAPIQKELTYKQFFWDCCEFIDRVYLGLPIDATNISSPTSPAQYASMTMLNQQREIKTTGRRNTTYDFDFSVCYVPTRKKLFALLYTEQPELTKAWESIKGVKDYHYQNSSDKPKNISAREWKKRRDAWDQATGNDKPCERGMTNEFPSPPPFLFKDEADEVLHLIPSLERRATYWAKNQVIEERMKEKVQGRKFEYSDAMEAMDFIRTEEGKKVLKKAVEEIKPKLLQEITKEVLFNDCTKDVK